MNIPNCYLYEAVTETGGLLQALVPFGEDPIPYLEKAQDDLDVIAQDWEIYGVVHASTLRALFNSVELT